MQPRFRDGVRFAALLLTVLAAAPACGDDTKPAPAPTGAATSPSAPALALGHATMDTPADGSEVKQCAVFTGKANLPADKTLILGVHNLDNNDPNRYFQPVAEWEYPTDLHNWKGAQWFGSRDDAAGQHFRIELLLIDLKQAQKFLGNKAKSWDLPQNPLGSEVAAHMTVKRVKGKGPAECS
jgi:eukaryotic-like serine/threonine-protein kinase